MNNDRSRQWFIRITKTNNTKNGLYEYNFDDIYNMLIDKYDIVIMALHDKDITNIHSHIIIQNSSQIRFSTLKKLFPYGDIEHQRGNNKECYTYLLHTDEKSKEREKDIYDETCLKSNIEDFEKWFNTSAGERNDITTFRDLILSGKTRKELFEICPNMMARYKDFYNQVCEMRDKELFGKNVRNLQVVYIYGGAGLGKTSLVYNENGFDNVYSVHDYSHPFDEYENENVILFDEYRSNFDITYFLKLLDIYPLILKARYKNKYACYTKVYIISNIPLSEQYVNADKSTKSALYRRIDKEIHFTELGKFETFYHLKNIQEDKKINEIF